MKKQFLVIGVGRFGKSLIKELDMMGHDVVACDTSESLLQEVDRYTHHTILGDATEPETLDDLQPREFDTVIVAIGDRFDASILIVKRLKDLGCEHIVSKANDHTRGEILAAVGANQVVYPEEEAGVRLAKKVANPGLIEVIELAPQMIMMEMTTPPDFVGKTLSELNFRRKYRATVLMITSDHIKAPNVSPSPDDVLKENDKIFVVGDSVDLERLKRKSE